MVRHEKLGIKKGPWTPEEDDVLVSYVQEHGPGNWSAVPTNTGKKIEGSVPYMNSWIKDPMTIYGLDEQLVLKRLLRCSKSCRLRWTNYLRPGIKRGNFTPHEEGMIIHLQALLGNKWAAISTYLPQRTDNDIKNYWNTHLKKKLKKLQSTIKPKHERSIVKNDNFSSQRLPENSSVYASSAENISRLLEGWMRSSSSDLHDNTNGQEIGKFSAEFDFDGANEMENIFSFNHQSLINSMACEKLSAASSHKVSETSDQEKANIVENNPPFFSLEKWLLDENAHPVGGDMDIPSMF